MISIFGEREAMKKLGERLRAERLRRNFSQAYLASVAKVTIPTYRKIENGDGKVEFRHVARALGFFGYSEALGALVPEASVELKLKDLLAPQRKHASRRKK
ncbi:MAG: helix-turn-helix domain-containing protein [Chthoniobacterales bacterium]|nr:helix-turn-helix domain-containing protein [Chthoniobacterales bacterium]